MKGTSTTGLPCKPLPIGRGLSLLALNWIIPGAGFWACGRWRRGTAQFLLVMLTFGLGLCLKGGVAWPSWDARDQEFNLLNNFTFIVQLAAGFPALGSLMADRLQAIWPALTANAAGVPLFWTLLRPIVPFLGGTPHHYLYELGSYYLIVAGAVNYFSVLNLYDRIVRPHPRYRKQEELGEESAEPEGDRS